MESNEINQNIDDITLKENINTAINNDEPIKFIIYKLSDRTEQQIQLALNNILDKFNRPDLIPTIYTCIKELLVNAIKANLKIIFFKNNNWNINDEDDYKKGTKEYKIRLGEDLLEKHMDTLIKNNQSVELKFNYSENGMMCEIINMTPMSKYDDRSLREKLKHAMNADDIADFFISYGDDTEGAGIGLALVILLLKGEEIDPALFRIGVVENKTIARIEIPFTDAYQPIRMFYESIQ